MLFTFSECYSILKGYGKTITGVLHIGAYECEEIVEYANAGIDVNNMYWVDAVQEHVDAMRLKGIPNVYCAALDNKESIVKFHITNNGQSSSLLDLGTHEKSYPDIYVTESREVKTQTLKNFIESNEINISQCNFWNLDIQGKELDVILSGGDYIKHADAICCEVNTEEVYKGCCILDELDAALIERGFCRIKISMTENGWGDALYVRV
jgi:FkbM family methyltransferase